jgi:hypothetical protein
MRREITKTPPIPYSPALTSIQLRQNQDELEKEKN